jgi:hypothetical protein
MVISFVAFAGDLEGAARAKEIRDETDDAGRPGEGVVKE